MHPSFAHPIVSDSPIDTRTGRCECWAPYPSVWGWVGLGGYLTYRHPYWCYVRIRHLAHLYMGGGYMNDVYLAHVYTGGGGGCVVLLTHLLTPVSERCVCWTPRPSVYVCVCVSHLLTPVSERCVCLAPRPSVYGGGVWGVCVCVYLTYRRPYLSDVCAWHLAHLYTGVCVCISPIDARI